MCNRCDCCKCQSKCCEPSPHIVPQKHGEVPVLNEWRRNLVGNEERSRILEALLSILPPLPDLSSWSISPALYENCITGSVSGKTLQEFTAYVRQLSDVLGPPDSFEFESTYEDRAPDFCASWRIRHGVKPPRVRLKSERPECKMDPRTAYRSPKIEGNWEYPKLHPECLGVLDKLKEEIENDFEMQGAYCEKGNGHQINADTSQAMDAHMGISKSDSSEIPF